MATSVALLRGINVGGHNKLPMSDLRQLFVAMGFTNVRTFIQSGNIAFDHAKAVSAKAIETRIADQFSINTTVVVQSTTQMQAAIKENPFSKMDTSALHFGFATQKIDAASVAKLDLTIFEPELFAAKETHLFFFLPNGMAHTKLPAYIARSLKVDATVRNWNSVNKLIDLMNM